MLKIITTQLKVIPGMDMPVGDYEISSALIMKNEPFSFQLVYSHNGDSFFQPVSIDVDSPLPAEAWRVDCVPITYAANDYGEPGYAASEPGLVPDLLEPRPLRPEISKYDAAFDKALYLENGVEHTLNATRDMQSMLVTLNPEGIELDAGKYTVNITMRELSGLETTDIASLEIEVVDARLPEQDFYVTNWFHVDCLCDFYGCEPYSDRFYMIFKTFVRNMTHHRQNTLLLPAFTPALDTPIGGTRKNVQLVDIEKIDGRWSFDFTRLARFMRAASDGGIKFFEHCHLFSQWGATKTPNIYDVHGNRLFGWDTDASGKEYTEFIRAYLKAFVNFIHSEGYSDDSLIFHISDEPTDKMLESYRNAYNTVSDLLAPFKCIDALSEIDFYRRKLVKTPVANVSHMDVFSKECKSFWVYYTCGTYVKMCTSRLITVSAPRTRALGAQMFKYRAEGFLHWGYNYYYDRMGTGIYDPKSNPCGYKQLPGSAHLAYPERNGAVPSLREVYMRESFDDIRTLKLYEQLSSREMAVELMERSLGEVNANLIPEGNSMYSFSQTLKASIKQLLNNK